MNIPPNATGMLEYIILLLIGGVFMARRPHTRRRRFSLRRVRITPELPLLTLASDTALTVALTAAGTGTYRAMSVNATWSVQGLTAEDGPITLGYAHSDYNVAQIKEALESAASINLGNKLEQEESNRLVRIVGLMSSSTNSLNDGKPIKTRLNWLISIGDTVVAFAYNENTSALSTGAVFNLQGDLWVKDSV